MNTKNHHPAASQQNSFWATLKVLFPSKLLPVILFPFLFGIFVNYQLIDFRQILITLVWLSVFTLPFLWTKKHIFYYLAAFFFSINAFVDLSHWILTKAPVSAAGLFVLFNTNLEEATGFAALKWNFTYLLVIPFLYFVLKTFLKPPKTADSLNKTSKIISFILALVSIGFITENSVHHRLVREGIPVLPKTIISYYQEVKAYAVLKEKKSADNQQIIASAASIDNPQLYILVLGESANRNHFSLYGYHQNTNPFLSQNKELIIYDNVISAYTHTMKSVPVSLSNANWENQLNPAHAIHLAEIFKAAGFKTYWLSNQSPIGIWDNIVTLFAEQFDQKTFINISGSSSKESLKKRSYDELLFAPLQNILQEKADKKLIIVHLMGSHSDYSRRYPSDFNVFKAEQSSKKDRTIAAYDNSILYNDFVVDSLFRLLKIHCSKNNISGASIYVSDHGENVYDEGDYSGHDYSDFISRHIVEIPFMLWLSPAYQQHFSETTNTITDNQHLPFMTDDLFHALIDLAQISTPHLEKNRSIFNKDFNNQRKRILENNSDYDLSTKKH